MKDTTGHYPRLLVTLVLFLLWNPAALAFVRGEPRVCRHPSCHTPSTTTTPTQLYAAAPKKKKAVSKKKKAAPKKTVASKKAAPEVSLKKAEFVTAVADKTGLSKKDADVAIQAVLGVITEEVANGKRVSLQGFGSFTLKHRSARKGRNPQTGEEIDIPASKAPGFTAAKAWKDALNGR